jgi:hypothetical protein
MSKLIDMSGQRIGKAARHRSLPRWAANAARAASGHNPVARRSALAYAQAPARQSPMRKTGRPGPGTGAQTRPLGELQKSGQVLIVQYIGSGDAANAAQGGVSKNCWYLCWYFGIAS